MIFLYNLYGSFLFEIANTVEPEPVIDTISKPEVLSLFTISNISSLTNKAELVKELLT